MRISDMNWMQVEQYLTHDDRAVPPLGDGLAHSGFRRILVCNGHGGNGAVAQRAQEWSADGWG